MPDLGYEPGSTSNKPKHYILDYGEYNITRTLFYFYFKDELKRRPIYNQKV